MFLAITFNVAELLRVYCMNHIYKASIHNSYILSTMRKLLHNFHNKKFCVLFQYSLKNLTAYFNRNVSSNVRVLFVDNELKLIFWSC